MTQHTINVKAYVNGGYITERSSNDKDCMGNVVVCEVDLNKELSNLDLPNGNYNIRIVVDPL